MLSSHFENVTDKLVAHIATIAKEAGLKFLSRNYQMFPVTLKIFMTTTLVFPQYVLEQPCIILIFYPLL